MRKSPLQSLLFIIISVFIFSACSKIPEQMNVIPSDASMVVVFNTKQLLLKSRMDKFNDTKLFKKIKSVLEPENAALSKLFDEIVKDPDQTGIKVLSDMSFFLKGDGKRFSAGFVAGVKNKEKLESFFNTIIKETKQKIQLVNDGDITYIIHNGIIMAWNKSALLLHVIKDWEISEKEIINQTKNLLNQQKEKSIVSVPDFKKFIDNKKDIDMWFSGENFIKMNPEQQQQIIKSVLPESLFKYTMHIHSEFKNGEIAITSERILSEAFKNEFKDMSLIKKFDNEQILKAIPENPIMVANISLNMKTIYEKFISKIPQLEQINANIGPMGLSVKDIFDSFGGDFTFAINKVDMEEKIDTVAMSMYNNETFEEYTKDSVITKHTPKIDGLFCISLTSSKVLDTLLSKIPEGQLQKEGNVITLPLPFMPVYLGIDKKMIVLASQKEIAEKAPNEGVAKNFQNTDMGKKLKNNASYFYLNMNLNSYPGLEKSLFADKDKDPKKMAAYNMWKIFDTMEASGNESQSEGIIKFTSSSDNSLYLILKTIDDNFDKFIQ